MQNDNSEIEAETISRLQLIEKFGQDAKDGLEVAMVQRQGIKTDIDE
jgi:hypothetical protein